jgi:hypothetical protein
MPVNDVGVSWFSKSPSDDYSHRRSADPKCLRWQSPADYRSFPTVGNERSTKPSSAWQFGSTSSFGSSGAGGSLGFADPAGIVYAYVTSQMGTTLTGDPRDVALREPRSSAISASLELVRLAA